MVPFVQKMLELSMRLGKRKCILFRAMGAVIGFFPVWYVRRLEKRLFSGKWDPLKKYRKKH